MIVIPDGPQLEIEQRYAHRSGLRGIRDILADLLVTYELAGASAAEAGEAGAAKVAQPGSPARARTSDN